MKPPLGQSTKLPFRDPFLVYSKGWRRSKKLGQNYNEPELRLESFPKSQLQHTFVCARIFWTSANYDFFDLLRSLSQPSFTVKVPVHSTFLSGPSRFLCDKTEFGVMYFFCINSRTLGPHTSRSQDDCITTITSYLKLNLTT